tara:strand:+ start:224 stop:520 length:297 start_codon:yes stop_codon:yes gene_type:complete
MKNNILYLILLLISITEIKGEESPNISIKIIAQNCNGCHGFEGDGGNNFLPIKGKNYLYFVDKMKFYKNQKNNSIMNRLTSVLSIQDIHALANYYYPD